MTAAYSAPLDEVTTAVLTLLRTGTRDVWDGVYAGDPLAPGYPYHLLYRIAGGNSDAMPDLDLDLRVTTVAFQVSTVATLRNQCEHAAREARDLLLGRTPTGWATDLDLPAGWQCIDRRPDPAMPGVDRVGEPPLAVYTQPARYLLTIAPA